MKRYEITTDIIANCVPFEAGDVVEEDEIHADCLVNMVRLGQCVELPPGAEPTAAAPAPRPGRTGRRKAAVQPAPETPPEPPAPVDTSDPPAEAP